MTCDNWADRWPNFTKEEVRCPLSLVVGVQEEAMDALQSLRDLMGEPLTINSGYRSPEHNKDVGGKKGSYHLKGLAFDISLRGHNKWRLLRIAKDVGFRGFGFYNTFLHVDLGPKRTWGSWV